LTLATRDQRRPLRRLAFLRRAYLPAGIWATAIWVASSFDWGASPWRKDGLGLLGHALLWLFERLPSFLPPDKFIHAVVYAVLGAALRAPSRLPGVAAGCVAFGVATLWGALDELHQSFVPGRMMDAYDLLADACGATLGVTFAVLALALRRRFATAGRGPALG
jgi:hypothetical protein